VQETMRQLIRTQKVDAAISVIDGELAKFPIERAAIEAEMNSIREEIVAAKADLESAELEERRVENKMRDQEALIERLNHQSGQVSSNQAYTALQHELDAAADAKAEFETAALEHMESIDTARGCVAQAEERLAGLEAAAPGKKADIGSRKSVLNEDRTKQVELRGKESAGIDLKVMARYDRIRERKQPAVVVIDGKSCPECKIVLPRLRLSEIMRLEELHACTSCKRLLVSSRVMETE